MSTIKVSIVSSSEEIYSGEGTMVFATRSLGEIGIFGFWSMMVFLGVLTIGFIYEWRKGALEWE